MRGTWWRQVGRAQWLQLEAGLVAFAAALAMVAIAQPLPAAAAAAEVVQLGKVANTVTHVVTRGETLGGILGGYGVGSSEARRWWSAARPKRDLSRLSVGNTLDLSFSADRTLMALSYSIDREDKVVVENDGANLRARIESRAFRVEAVGVRGGVQTTFFAAALRAGLPKAIISQMVDLLAQKINFSADIRPGDRFRVLYEKRSDAEGHELKPGALLAAEYRGQRHSLSTFLYSDGEGHNSYLDSDGRALDGSLLRYPLEFTRISSAFSYSRFHPILKYRRPHLGVDFAAPIGTPVRSVGSGKVRWAAWKGGLGRHVEVDHGDGLVSAYSHLRSIAPVARPGAVVERGEVIGWVGKSGSATGPHLHFAIFDKGKYINPLNARRVATMAKVDPARFAKQRDQLAQNLRAATTSQRPSDLPVPFSALAQARHLEPLSLTL